MTFATLATFGTDTYGAQLSCNFNWEEKTSGFLLLTVVDGKHKTKDFTDFADAVDAYEEFKSKEHSYQHTSVDNLITNASGRSELSKDDGLGLLKAREDIEK